MKYIDRGYRELLDNSVEVGARAQVRAEWSWNNTQFLSDPSRRASKIQVIDNSGLYKNVAASLGEAVNQDGDQEFFKRCFDIEENNRLNGISEYVAYNDQIIFDEQGVAVKNPAFSAPAQGPFIHYSPTWKDGENKPNFDFEKHFSTIVEFHLDIREEGWHLFKIEADDRYELYLFDETMQAPKLVAHNYVSGDWWFNPEERNGYVAAYYETPGRYYMKGHIQNVDLASAFVISKSTPKTRREKNEATWSGNPTIEIMKDFQYEPLTTNDIFYPDDNGPRQNPEVVGLARIIEKNTFFDEDSGSIKYGREDVGSWGQWRQYFPTDSLTKPHRPDSGINYNIIEGEVIGQLGSSLDYINRPLEPRKPRYYSMSTNWQKYQYWVSDCESNETEFGEEGYPIPLADLVVRYEKPVPSNKITATFNTLHMPKAFKVLISSELYGDVWDEIGSHETMEINPFTGKLEMWRTDSGLWTQDPQLDEDYSVGIRRLRLVVMTMHEPKVRVSVIELAAKKHIDITESVESFDTDANMNEVEQFRILGVSSANSGSVTLSNLDKRFSFDHVSDIRRANLNGIATETSALKDVVERQTKFTFDIIYDDHDGSEYQMRIATMYGTDWDESDDAYKIKLHDSAKYLQNTEAPDIIFEDEPIHYAIGAILDLIGFSKYSVDLSDFKKNQLPTGEDEISTPVLKYFATDPSQDVWKNLQDICEATYSAVYFDEFGVLQLVTRDEITRPMQRDELTRQTIEPPAHVFRGQVHEGKLANISSFSKNHEDEANSVVVNFKPKRIKDNGDPFQPRQLTDILWQSDYTITLQAGRIVKTLSKAESNEYWIDNNQEKAELWPYAGKANINGEVIAWNGKEYQWTEYVWEKYVDVLVNITNVPRLIEPWMWILRDAINLIWDGAQALVDLLIPKEIRFLGFKTDLFGLNNWLTQLIKVDKESKMMMIHEPFYVYETIFFSKKSDQDYELDRILVSQHLRREWIYNQTQKNKRDEHTGRGGGFQRPLNQFTGRIKLVQETDENTRGRGVDESKYRAEHTHLPRDGWYAKKLDANTRRITDGYFNSKEGSEKNKMWFPILSNDFTARGDTYLTSIGVNRFNSSGLKRSQHALLTRTVNRPAKSFGFRFRIEEAMPDNGEIGFIFGLCDSRRRWFVGANKWHTDVPDNINDCDSYYKVTIRLTSDKQDKGRVSEVMGEIATDDAGYNRVVGSGPLGLIGNTPADDTGFRGNYYLRNLNPYEKDNVVEYRGYRNEIKKKKWYDVQIEQGDSSAGLFTVYINGKTVGTFVPPEGRTWFGFGPESAQFRQIMPYSKHFGLFVTPGVRADFDYVWSWSEDTGLMSYNSSSRYDTSKGQYISSFLETGILVPDEENREYRSTEGKLGEFFYDDFGSTVREIREVETELDKGPGMGITYYVSNPNARMFNLTTTPNKARFSLVNLGGHMVIASGDEKTGDNKSIKNTIVVYGYKISEEQEKTIMRQNTAAIKDRGEVKEEIDAKWISTDEEAVELANWIVQNFSDVKDTLSLEIFPDASVSIGDRVQIIYDEKDIDPEWIYLVSAVSWGFSSKGISCSIEVRRVRNNNIEYYDMYDPVYGIQKEEIRESDKRDTGELSEGGISGLTLYGPQLPNPTGEPVSGEAAESPTWKTRYPIKGMIYDTAAGLAVDALGKVATLAITTGLSNFGVPPAVGGVVSNFASTMITDIVGNWLLDY